MQPVVDGISLAQIYIGHLPLCNTTWRRRSWAPEPDNCNLATIQGGGEVMFELVPLLGRADFATAWLRVPHRHCAGAEVWDRDRTTHDEGADAGYVIPGQSGPRPAAWAYARSSSPPKQPCARHDFRVADRLRHRHISPLR